jgi:hypothetical protein
MNLWQARKMVDYLNTIKTQAQKDVNVGIIHDRDDVKKYGGFCVRIHDHYREEICEYYKLTHSTYKSMHEEVRTDFTRVYREHGHVLYDMTGLN